jgi:hypothetical protein
MRCRLITQVERVEPCTPRTSSVLDRGHWRKRPKAGSLRVSRAAGTYGAMFGTARRRARTPGACAPQSEWLANGASRGEIVSSALSSVLTATPRIAGPSRDLILVSHGASLILIRAHVCRTAAAATCGIAFAMLWSAGGSTEQARCTGYTQSPRRRGLHTPRDYVTRPYEAHRLCSDRT